MADRPVANLRDLPAFAGVLLALTALALPWSRRRACPIFEDCGPWETVSGWETFGAPALIGLALALTAFVVVPDPAARRVLPAVFIGVLGVVLAMHQGMSIEVFTDTQGPLAGFHAFVAGLALAAAGWLGSALLRSLPRPEPPGA